MTEPPKTVHAVHPDVRPRGQFVDGPEKAVVVNGGGRTINGVHHFSP